MATFVLVHPAWFGGWCWKKVSPLLRARGHDVFTPTLTGLGDRAHLARPEVGLATHVEDVANVLMYEDLSGVVLVGNSSGGMVITGVADRAPERIGRLVYLDNFEPEDGQCLLDLVPPDRRPTMEALVAVEGAGWLLPRFAAAPWERFVPEVWQGSRMRPTCAGFWPGSRRPRSDTSPSRSGAATRPRRRCRGPTFAACSGRIRASTTTPMQPAARRGGVAASLRPRTFHTSPIPASWLPYCSKTLCRPKSSRNPPANHPAITLAAAVRESGRLARSVGVGNPDLLEPEQ